MQHRTNSSGRSGRSGREHLITEKSMRIALAVLALAAVAAPVSAQEKKVIGNPPSTARISPAIVHGNTLWVSGQLGVAPARDSTAPNDIKAQTTRTLENVKRLVEEAGTTMDRGLHCTVFLTDIADFQAMNEVYVTFFTKDRPTRSTVAVVALANPSAKVEIECQFAMPAGK